jgi:hypothetical protein
MVQVGALVQTAVATGAGLRRDPVSAVARGGVLGANGDASQVYLTALVVGTAAAVALGAAVFLGISAAPAPLALVALAVASIAFASWCNGLVVAVTGVGDALATDLLRAIRWVPPVVTGLGVAATRLRTPGRVLGSVVALTTLWVGTAAVTAVSSAVGSRVLLSRPRELVDYGAAVFRSALGPAGDGLTLAAAAAVIGVVGAAVVAATAHRRRRPEPA